MKKLAFLLPLLLLLTACGGAQEKHTTQIFAMDTVMDLTVYGDHAQVLQQAPGLIAELEKNLSVTDPDSEIGILNSKKEARLSPETAALLSVSLELCEKTDGALDISVYPVVKAWGFTTGSYRIPSPGERLGLAEHVDYRAIEFSPADATVRLKDQMEMDLGSVAKGWAGDRLLELFRQQGVTSALLNLGGNVQALGEKPDGSPFQIGLQDPRGQGYLGVLSIRNEAVITSGGYQRFFEGEDGEIYWHIMDPATGAPARSGLISATAVGPEGVTCDALSTALFIMGPEKALEFWKTHQDFQMILVTEDNQVLITEPLADRFVLSQGSSYELKVIS